MADLVRNLQKLQSFSPDVHLFCPRASPDDTEYFYDEDLHGQIDNEDQAAKERRLQKLAEAAKRKGVVLECLKILAYDGPDAAPYIKWLKERLDAQMTSCDVCIRIYHRARAELKQGLEEQHDEEEVARFLDVFDDMNIARIRKGLDHARDDLMDRPPTERAIGSLDSQGLYAIFETLSCAPFLWNESLLEAHFDQPFRLVQAKKKLRLNSYTPAMTSFLLGKNEFRSEWAIWTWSKFKKNLSSTEFDWVVREWLVRAMQRVLMTCLDAAFLPSFWAGVKLIVSKLDKDLITHSLRPIDVEGNNIYQLALKHLIVPSECFMDQIGSIQLLLEKSPSDFWDAMGTISPSTVLEQIFNNPTLGKILLGSEMTEEVQRGYLEEAFSWLDPFLNSIKPSNLAPACRKLVEFFMGRLQNDKYSRQARSYAYKLGLRALSFTLRKLSESKSRATFVGAATVSDIVELVDHHLSNIIAETRRAEPSEEAAELAELCFTVVQQLLALDCLSLEVERQSIISGGEVEHEHSTSATVWKTLVQSITQDNLELPIRILLGARSLTGLEKFSLKPGVTLSKDIKHFNEKLNILSQSVTDVVDRLGDFSTGPLEKIFQTSERASAVTTVLFSSEAGARQAVVELLKVISSQDGRREALAQILGSNYSNTLSSISLNIRRIARKRVFAPASAMLRLATDVVETLCNPQDGLLRSRTLTSEEAKTTETFWQALWQALTIIFEMTEEWSNMGHDKTKMMDFCRDTMQFADRLFDQCSIFATALREASPDTAQKDDRSGVMKALLNHPAITMNGMVKWLRLRDEYLSSKSVTLISKLLVRLQEVGIEVGEEPLFYVEDIINNKVKRKLSPQQLAELERALEIHIGHSINKIIEPAKPAKQGSISSWVKTGAEAERLKAISTVSSDADDSDNQLAKIIADNSKGAEAYKAHLAERMASKKATFTAGPVAQKIAQRNQIDVAELKRRREAEKEAKKKRDAAAIAAARKLRGMSDLNAEAGSGLQGLGVPGKEHATKGTGMMVSSDESSDDEDDDPLDRELFGLTKQDKKAAAKLAAKQLGLSEAVPLGPVKKKRIVRSFKDMRARLAPDLSPLHKILLSWDYFHGGDFPPNSRPDMYTAVPNKFQTPMDYQNTFQPLLTLEAWQGFVKAREESTFKPYEIKVANRSNVDAFIEVSSTMTHQDNKEINVSEGDIVLMSKAPSPATSAQAPHCLARVFRIQRKKAYIEVSYRAMPGNPLASSMSPGATIYGAKIQSLTPLEREYGALLGLQYYDLCDEIIKAKPSPLLKYTDKQLDPLISNYNVNKAQAKAIKSAIDNDAFTLIQGPPGSGKTKTIVGIVGAVLTDTLNRTQGTAIATPKAVPVGGASRQQAQTSDAASKKLLVCAPSNAAVDELVMRLKEGVKTVNGQHKKINVVRLGRSDAVNASILDVTLDELVNARLGNTSDKNAGQRAETQKLMAEHQGISEKLRIARDKLDKGEAKGGEYTQLKDEFDALRRRKTQLGTQIDNARDNEQTMNRQAELNRRRVQQQILDESHVICATLSGSGHEMFQSLNIEFETVIVDEAAQCVEISAIIPLKYGCAKCILVGDPKQLPPTVFSKEAARFQYEQSLFVRMQTNHPDDVHLLDTQYRMHPEISAFPSATFYDGRLLDGDNMAALRERPWHASELLAPYRFFDVQGQHQAAPKGHSLINIAEIEVAIQLFERLTTDFRSVDFKGKIGIITPYKSQLRELKERFSRKFGNTIFETVDFNTTDAFQGRESEVIIFSCVRASPAGGIGFLQDIRRMNVGLTRAKSSLWVLGNSQSLVRGEFWRKLVEDARERDRYTQGNLQAMLRQPSTNFPRKQRPVAKAKVVKQEPNGKAADKPPAASFTNVMKEIKSEPGATIPIKRKKSDSDNDVDMKDIPWDSAASRASSSKPSASGRSTPATPDPGSVKSEDGNGTTSATAAAASAQAGQPQFHAPKPKIRRRPEPVDPLIRRNPPKRPKPT